MNETFSLTNLRAKLSEAHQDGRPHMLLRSEVAAALQAFLEGKLSEQELADWAEFFDGNEHVEFEAYDVMPDILFTLSTPEINGPPSVQRVREILASLASS